MESVENGAKISRFREILPQVIASTVKNFLLLDLGLSIAFPTIVIPALMGLNNALNPDETVHLTAVQASWLASIAYLFKLIGSVLSGWITEPIGRKKAMFFVNLPHLIGWFMLYRSTTVVEVFVAQSLFGAGVGLMEAPILTYVGEICEASIRGVIMALAGISATLGLFIVFTLANLTAWRNVALICFFVPVITMVAVCFIPESPQWLLSKKRDSDALKSLQWLRGWVPVKNVQREFETVKRYNEFSNSCSSCEKAKIKCTHPPPNTREKFKELLRKRTLKPFIIIVNSQAVGNFSGIHHLMPYIVPILNTYKSPISPNWATVLLGVTGVFGTIVCVIIVKFVGKRKIHLISLAIVTLINLLLGAYGYYYLPSNTKSYEATQLAVKTETASMVPLVLFILLRFFTIGALIVPFMMLSELFPFKSRCFATGITAAVGYITGFFATKSFYNLEYWFDLPTALVAYGLCGIIGSIIAYKILPETEKRTLEEIEIHFSNNQRKLTDRKIAPLHSNVELNREIVISCDQKNEQIIVKNVVNGLSNRAFVPDKY